MTQAVPEQTPNQPDHGDPAFREAFKVGVPTFLGIAAWGMVVGIAMIKTNLSVPQALAMTLLVFAGSAQLATLPLIATHAPLWVIFATALVINLRFVIFSALMAPHFSHLPWKQRFWFGYLAGDMTVAMFLQRYPDDTKRAAGKLSYLKGLLFPNWVVWQTGSILGIFVGTQIPPQWGLDFAGTLAILCITVPLVAGRAALCGVAVAGVVSLLAAGWPYKLGLLAAVVSGMLSAMAVDEWSERRPL